MVLGLLSQPSEVAEVPDESPVVSPSPAESPQVPSAPPAASPEPAQPASPARETPPEEAPPQVENVETAEGAPSELESGRTVSDSAAVEPAQDDEGMPGLVARGAEDPDDEEFGEDGPVRRGVVLSGMLGYAGCGKPWCQGYRGGFGGGVELGVRFRRIMPVVAWGGGIGPYDRATLEDEVGITLEGKPTVKMHVIGVGASLFPLGKENRRIDPHFGARIGYGLVRLDFGGDGLEVTERVKRGVITLGGGLDGFVTDNLSVGLRFDMHIMFGGKACINVRADNGASAGGCQESGDLESRADPRDWPLPFAVTAQIRRTWGF